MLKIIKKINLFYLIIIFLMIFPLMVDFGFHSLNNFLPIICLIVYLLNYKPRIKVTAIRVSFIIVSLCILIISIFHPSSFAKDSLPVFADSMHVPIYFFMFSFYVLICRLNDKIVIKSGKLLFSIGIIISLYIVLTKIYPDFYLNCILPFLYGLNKANIKGLMNIGYGLQIGGSTIYGDYMIILASFVGLAYLKTPLENYSKKKILLAELLFFLAMIIEGRKGELLCFIISIIFLELISINLFRLWEYFKLIKKLLFVFILFVITIIGLSRTDYLTRFIVMSNRITEGENLNTIASGRINCWILAVENFIETPLVGKGWYSFPYMAQKDYRIKQFWLTHNVYLQFLSEIGIMGSIFIWMPIIFVYYKIIIAIKYLHKIKYNCNLANIISSFIAFGIFSFFLLLNCLDPCFHKYLMVSMLALGFLYADYSYKCL